MKQTTLIAKALVILSFIYGTISLTSCKKEAGTSSGEGFGNVPRKEAPDPFTGQFIYVTTTGGYVDQYGHYIDAVSQGVTLHINRNGTGSYSYLAKTVMSTGVATTDEIRTKCTFEITKISDNQANIIIHFVSGQNYHNGVYRHDLTAAQLYPNGDTVYDNVEYGTNDQGKTYFIVSSGSYTSQFTQQ